MLGHVVEWAELILVPGGTATVRGVPAPTPVTPPLTHVDSTRLKHLPESLKRCAGPRRGECDTLSPVQEQVCGTQARQKKPTAHKTEAIRGKKVDVTLKMEHDSVGDVSKTSD